MTKRLYLRTRQLGERETAVQRSTTRPVRGQVAITTLQVNAWQPDTVYALRRTLERMLVL